MRDATVQSYVNEYKEWQETYRPIKFVEYSEENLKLMEGQDPLYVWTDHDTCENSQMTSGLHFFGDPPSCCWTTHGWHIVEVANESDYDSVAISAYLPCPVCNEDGDGEGAEDCVGPEPIDGAEMSNGCEDGWIQWYFD